MLLRYDTSIVISPTSQSSLANETSHTASNVTGVYDLCNLCAPARGRGDGRVMHKARPNDQSGCSAVVSVGVQLGAVGRPIDEVSGFHLTVSTWG
jgi:hypothetical protein